MLRDLVFKRSTKPSFYQVVQRTPLESTELISERLGSNVYLKREDRQTGHSFKLRGAYHKLLTLDDQQLSRGVIAASAGNHAQGVALGARLLGSSALIVMPETTPSIKVEAVRRLDAEVVLHGQSYSDAYARCQQIISQTGRVFIHPFDDELVIDGQGTVAEEVLSQLPSADYIFVPVGGGGLLAGIAKVAKALNPDIKIIGVEPTDSNAMTLSLDAGHPITLDKVGIFADGVAVKRVGDKTFAIAKACVDDMVNVDQSQICWGIQAVFEDNRAILEPAGALAMAGMEKYAAEHDLRDKNLVVICSGANVSFEKLELIAGQSAKS